MKYLILILTSLSLVSCNKKMSLLTEKNHKNDVWKAFKEGQKFANADAYYEAKQSYDLALNMDSKFAPGYLFRAVLNFDHGNYNETLSDLEKLEPFLWLDGNEAFKKTKQNKRLARSRLLLLRSESHLFLKNYPEAKLNLSKLVKLKDELYGKAVINKAFLEIIEKKYTDALSTLKLVEEANHKNYTFNILKAIAYDETKQSTKKTEALKTLRSIPDYYGYDLKELKYWNKGFENFEIFAQDLLGQNINSIEKIDNDNINSLKETKNSSINSQINAYSFLLVTSPVNCTVVINGLEGYRIKKDLINRLPMEQGLNIVQFQPFGEKENEIVKEFDFDAQKNQKFEIKFTGN